MNIAALHPQIIGCGFLFLIHSLFTPCPSMKKFLKMKK